MDPSDPAETGMRISSSTDGCYDSRDECPVLFLVNPISGEGHLDTYARLYSAALLNLGFRIVLVTEKEAGCTEWLVRHNVPIARFTIVTRLEKKECSAKHSKNQRRYDNSPAVGEPLRQTIKKWIGQLLEPFPWLRKTILEIGNRILARFSGQGVAGLNDRVRRAEAATGFRPDLVFILYPDLLPQDKKTWSSWSYPWVCIRFTPALGDWATSLPVEPLFQVPTLRGACFLDDSSTHIYRRRLSNLVFATVPDVCDPTLPDEETAMVRILRKRAAGRTVVFAGGGITGRKGFADLIEVISKVPRGDYFFLLIGKIHWSTFSSDEAAVLRKFIRSLPENVMTHFEYLEDERDFNALMASADIIYAVYRNFPHSSNMLAKAAYFEAALLVSNRYRMGRQVEKYGLGATVYEGDIEDIINNLEKLQHFDACPGAKRFQQAHSHSSLTKALGDFLFDTIKKKVA